MTKKYPTPDTWGNELLYSVSNVILIVLYKIFRKMDTSFIPKELMGKDVYKILGLSFSDANKENIRMIIRKKYLKCALVLHPDKKEVQPKEKEEEMYAENFSILKCAYEFLMNETLRKKYNLYIQRKGKTNPTINNTSLNRFLDKKKVVAAQHQKYIYKKKLEEREKNKDDAFSSTGKTGINEQKEQRTKKQRDLNSIKMKNEEFVKKRREDVTKQHTDDATEVQSAPFTEARFSERCTFERTSIHARQIEIYLQNYVRNIDLLTSYMKRKTFLTFFINFNFRKYHLNINEEDTLGERKVGYIIFTHPIEAVRAYTHYKQNIQQIDSAFKLRLQDHCSESVGMEHLDTSQRGASTREEGNIDEMMKEMVEEIDKVFASS
ncbi:DnaJ protein, putative [Plasmodium ovale curtisi]|uniref:DnaJ protein, putative n=2 Tax=Plasmodium ovale TaxID=36330 RepID=A0A1A8X0B5_PLAOA|nr:DnaJ protein, putative [Plasmodium ovale curtisi]